MYELNRLLCLLRLQSYIYSQSRRRVRWRDVCSRKKLPLMEINTSSTYLHISTRLLCDSAHPPSILDTTILDCAIISTQVSDNDQSTMTALFFTTSRVLRKLINTPKTSGFLNVYYCILRILYFKHLILF